MQYVTFVVDEAAGKQRGLRLEILPTAPGLWTLGYRIDGQLCRDHRFSPCMSKKDADWMMINESPKRIPVQRKEWNHAQATNRSGHRHEPRH